MYSNFHFFLHFAKRAKNTLIQRLRVIQSDFGRDKDYNMAQQSTGPTWTRLLTIALYLLFASLPALSFAIFYALLWVSEITNLQILYCTEVFTFISLLIQDHFRLYIGLGSILLHYFEEISFSRTNSNRTCRYEKQPRL